MPDKRKHRGKHPGDEELFALDNIAALRAAVGDLSWMLSRGYNETSALKLVGDRYALTRRQRHAVARCSCSDDACRLRAERCLDRERLSGRSIAIDGFNQLITIEAALSGGLVLRGRDGCFRDLSSIHGTYRSVCETPAAIDLLGELLERLGTSPVRWHLDQPVSNSGRLKMLLLETAQRRSWSWEVLLEHNPDRTLAAATDTVVASSDSWILDNCDVWTNLLGPAIEAVPSVWLLELAEAETE